MTTQLVAHAIARSKTTQQPACITFADLQVARTTSRSVRAELARECDSDVDDGDGWHTYRGKDLDDVKWIVSVDLD